MKCDELGRIRAVRNVRARVRAAHIRVVLGVATGAGQHAASAVIVENGGHRASRIVNANTQSSPALQAGRALTILERDHDRRDRRAVSSVVVRSGVAAPTVRCQCEPASIASTSSAESSSTHPATIATSASNFTMRGRLATGAPLQPRETTRRALRNRDTRSVPRDRVVVISVACHRAVAGLSL